MPPNNPPRAKGFAEIDTSLYLRVPALALEGGSMIDMPSYDQGQGKPQRSTSVADQSTSTRIREQSEKPITFYLPGFPVLSRRNYGIT